jgi:putative membrane protein
MKKMLLCSTVAALALAGCNTDTTSTTSPSPTTRARTAEQTSGGSAATPARAGTLTDAQVLDVATVVNRGEVLAADAVEGKLTSQEAKDFQKMMKGEHEAAMNDVRDLMTRIGIRNEEAPMSAKLRNDAQQVVQKLQGASGPDVDRVYLQSQIDMHQDALRIIDDQLLPQAKNAEVVALLRKMRPKVAAHLDRARELHRAVGKADMSTGR